MVLAYATLAGARIAVSDALIQASRSLQKASPTVRMGRVGPVYLPPVGAGGML